MPAKVAMLDGKQKQKGWFIIGASPTIDGPFTHARSFPEFNLLDGSNSTRYRIPKESLSVLYASLVPNPGMTTPQAMDGVWTVGLSPDLKCIAITRIWQLFTAIGGISLDFKDEINVNYAIIKNFTLDATHNVIDLTGATVTQGSNYYPFNGIDYGGSFLVWPPFYANYTDYARSVITFDSNSNAIIDLYGYSDSQAGTTDLSFGGTTLTNEDTRLWQALDITGANTIQHNNHGLATDNSFTINYYNGIITNYGQSEEQGYRDSHGTASVAYAYTNKPPIGGQSGTYYLSPQGSIVTNFPSGNGSEIFVIDTTRPYTNYNSSTSWGTHFSSVHATNTGKFLDFYITSGSPNSTYILKTWSYDSVHDTIIAGKTITSTISNNLHVLGLSGPIAFPAFIDWQIK